jgi:hypothetical protein
VVQEQALLLLDRQLLEQVAEEVVSRHPLYLLLVVLVVVVLVGMIIQRL